MQIIRSESCLVGIYNQASNVEKFDLIIYNRIFSQASRKYDFFEGLYK